MTGPGTVGRFSKFPFSDLRVAYNGNNFREGHYYVCAGHTCHYFKVTVLENNA